MITFTIPQNNEGEQLLIKEKLSIKEEYIRIPRGETSAQNRRDENEISLLLARKNWIAIRQRKTENLVNYLLEQKQELSPHIEKEIKEGYDFYHIVLICSFLPDPTCKFTWARLTVKMQCKPKLGDLQAQEKPLVCD